MNILQIIVVVYVFCSSTILELSCEPEPLFLTPLLQAGQVDKARNLSEVKPLVDDIKSYAGYLTVNDKTESHLYFWFIPCTNANRKSAPLIVWLSGGPGITAMYGLFEETGPFEVDKDGKTVRRRKHAWTNNYHMLYVDQPVGTGFSFIRNETHGYIKTQDEVGEYLHETLLQFYKLFSEFKKNDLYIGGESYGGKYAPALAFKIHQINRQNKTYKIPLTGLIIASGYCDPENMLEYGEVLFSLGLIDKSERRKLEEQQDVVKSVIRSKKWCLANKRRQDLFGSIMDMINTTNLYDFTTNYVIEPEFSFLNFLSKNETRERIHACYEKKIEWLDMKVYFKFEEDMMKPVRTWIEKLLNSYRILFFNGNHDILVSHLLTQNFLEKLHWNGAAKYKQAKRQLWYEDDVVVGHYKVAGNLIDVLVFNAGHSVPVRQPKNTLRLIDMFMGNELNGTHFVNLKAEEEECIKMPKPFK